MINRYRVALFLFLSVLLAGPHAFASDTARQQEITVTITDNRVDLHARNADIRDVLNKIAEKADFTLNMGDDIKGAVTVDLENATLEQTLSSLTDNLALQFTFDPATKTYRIIDAASFATLKADSGPAESRTAQQNQAKDKINKVAVPAPSAQPVQKNPSPIIDDVERDSHGRPLYRADELLVTFTEEADDDAITTLNDSLGSTVLKILPRRKLYQIRIREGVSLDDAMNAYQKSELVLRAGRNTLRYPSATVPNDPSYDLQWNMDIIQAPRAWDLNRGSNETVVAVIDTGIAYNHPDLAANIWTNTAELNGITNNDDDDNGYIDDIRGWDFAENDNNPDDQDGHGTHIAGIIGAAGDNATGVTGINWQAGVMPLKVQPDTDDGFPTIAIIEAIDYAIDMGARVINCSYGSSFYDATEFAAMEDLRDAGILAACAAGNDGKDVDTAPEYPASFNLDNIVSVAAGTETDDLADFSNYGLANVDMAAPGKDVFSTITGITRESFVIHNNNPAIEYSARDLEYAGITTAEGITADMFDCGWGYEDEFPGGQSGYIAMIKRGNKDGNDFYFSTKVSNDMSAGAIGAVIYNNVSDSVPFNGKLGGPFEGPDNWIPAVALTKADGEQLLTRITANSSATLINRIVSDKTYDYLSGTSMAAPHVAGAAAMLYGLNPSLTYQEIRDIIFNSVDQIPAAQGKTVTGGRLNLRKALDYVFNLTEVYQPGDVNGDNRISLADAILALRSQATQNVEFCSICMERGAEVNGDGRFGHEEAIYILQKISDMR